MKTDKRKEKIRALSDGSNFHYAANSTKSKLIIHEKGLLSTIKFIIFRPNVGIQFRDGFEIACQ